MNDSKNEQTVEVIIGQTIQVVIVKAWIPRKKFEIPVAHVGFFPADALGARGKVDQKKYPPHGKPVEFDYGMVKDYGVVKSSTRDVATRLSGAMRPRNNSKMGQFLEGNNFEVGDIVCITRTGERNYKVSLVKPLR